VARHPEPYDVRSLGGAASLAPLSAAAVRGWRSRRWRQQSIVSGGVQVTVVWVLRREVILECVAPGTQGYRDQHRTHSRPSLRCVERETGLVAGWRRCTVCPALAVTAGTLAPIQHDASRWSAVVQLPGAMRMYLYTLRDANCQYRPSPLQRLCAAVLTLLGQRVGWVGRGVSLRPRG
jgi:hypothetical protein